MPTSLDFRITLGAKNQFCLEINERDNRTPLTKTTFDYDLSFLSGCEISGLDLDSKDPAARWERIENFGNTL